MRRRLTAILLTISLLFSFAVIFASAETAKLGDVNNDGKITAADARKTLRASAKLEELSAEQAKVADVDFNNRVSAADARLILRVSAKLDSFPEQKPESTTKPEGTTKEPESTTNPEETTTKPEETTKKPETTTKPEETTKKPETTTKPEETTKEPESTTKPEPEETTLPVLEPGVVVDEYPEAIDAFFSGKFYLNGQMVDGKTSTSLKMATGTQGTEMMFTIPDTTLNVSIYAKGKDTYLKLSSDDKKHYVELTDLLKDEMNIDFSEVISQLTSIKFNNPGKPVLTKGIFGDIDNGTEIECDIYTFSNDEATAIKFYAVEDSIIQISLVDANSVESNILISELTSKIPSNMLTTKGYTKTSIAFIPIFYPEFGGSI